MTKLSHEADMQPSLFERVDPLPPSETFDSVADMAKAIKAAAEKRMEARDEPDSTDKWLAETGGGGRKTDLMQDPPINRTPQEGQIFPNTRGGRSYPEASDSELDDAWQEGQRNLVDPGSQQAKTNLIEIASHRVQFDQKYFDELQAQVKAGKITRSRADALWLVRVNKSSNRSA